MAKTDSNSKWFFQSLSYVFVPHFISLRALSVTQRDNMLRLNSLCTNEYDFPLQDIIIDTHTHAMCTGGNYYDRRNVIVFLCSISII